MEYVMLRGINDKPEHASQLLDLLQGIEAKINLIVFNPHEGVNNLPLSAHCCDWIDSHVLMGVFHGGMIIWCSWL